MRKKVLVIEGPAGSGKTTLIERLLRDCPQAKLVEPQMKLDRPRTYAGRDVELSQTKDVLSAMNLIHSDNSSTPFYVIDRWTLSQWIYGHIRRLTPEYSPRGLTSSVMQSVGAGLQLVYSLWLDSQIRGGNHNPENTPPFTFMFVIMLPTRDLLESHRLASPKGIHSYPFDSGQELRLYQGACQALEGKHWFQDAHMWASSYSFDFDNPIGFGAKMAWLKDYLVSP